MTPYDIVLDMETGDPDDALSLSLLATHPWVNLRAVTVFPGGPDQVGLVRTILRAVGKQDVLVGAGTPKGSKPKSYLSLNPNGFYRRWLGAIEPETPDGEASDLLKRFPNADLITGAPLTNVWKAYQGGASFQSWTCQGGFVGDNLMPPELRLAKFNGRLSCPTWNLGGDPTAAQGLLGLESRIPVRRLVPKSVCHGITYTQEVHARIPSGLNAGLDLFRDGMAAYFRKKPEGKALHDIVATACALKPSIGNWIEVWPYYRKGEWGCMPPKHEVVVDMGADRSYAPIFALIKLDLDAFETVITGAS
jgi:pyrimidine-specific ribonucleoside hydrolase